MKTILWIRRQLAALCFVTDACTREWRRMCGALFVLGASAPAAYASLTPGWTPFLTIQSIVVEDGDAIVVIHGGVPPAYLRDDCNASPYNVIDISSAQGRSKLAIAMSAYNMGQPIQLALQACSGSRPMITHILVGSGL